MKRMYISIFTILFCWQSYAQKKTNKIIIHFAGKLYNHLDMIIRIDDGGERSLKKIIPGYTKNGKDWLFVYPDSMYAKHNYVSFEIPSSADSISKGIAFKTIVGNDTLLAAGVCFSKGKSNAHVEYSTTEVHPGVIYYNEEKKTYGIKTTIQDQFWVQPTNDKGLLSSIEALGFKYCMFPKSNSMQYDDQLELYVNMTKKYPKSHYSVFLLASNLNLFKSKKDIDQVYSCFLPEIKQSYFGERINNFLASSETIFEFDEYENTLLQTWDSNKLEQIITDTSKFNLIVFSASWCTPCHKQIPLLKKIHSILKDDLLITYVSMDKESTVRNWRKLMIKEAIPWRSLLATDYLHEIKEKYFVLGIPHTILVYPGGKKLEVLDIRKEKNYVKLLNLFQ